MTFDARKMRHFDHGYALTSHSSQGVTTERVLVNMETRAQPDLISTRFAYASVSRASHDAQIYTNDAATLGQRLSHDASKSSAIDFRNQAQSAQKGKPMENDSQHGLRPDNPGREAIKERVYTPTEHERHYGPLNRELHADDARQFGWTAESGTIQSYQHTGTRRHIHIDGPSGEFYDQQKNPIPKYAALEHALGAGKHRASEPARILNVVRKQRDDRSVGFGF